MKQFRFGLIFVGVAILAAIRSACGEVLNTSIYPYSCEITFSGYAGASTLEYFPALVRIPAGSDIYRGSGDGSDLRFTDSAGNIVPHEINSWKHGGESLVWVRVPSLSGKTTKLTLYFGAANNSQQVNSGDVWSGADYKGVWHFEGGCTEASTNKLSCYDCRVYTALPYASYTDVGPIGSCMHPHTNGYIVVNDSRASTFPEGRCTVSAWVKYDGIANGTTTERIISCKKNFKHETGFEIHKRSGNCTSVNAISSGNVQRAVNTLDFSVEPIYLTVAFADGKTTAYTNGVLSLTTSSSVLVSTLTNLCIASMSGGGGVWNGTLDELRLQNVQPSADWVAADYATQSSTNFAVLGEVVRQGGTLVDEKDYSFKRTITFSGYTGSTALANFPALVRIPAASAFVSDVPGGNLRFADADGYLIPHEFDTWDVDGSALVWVRVPVLAGTTTQITMYGGVKASAPAALASGSVWSRAGYQGVWHFASDGKDSSANAFSSSVGSGTTFVTNGVVGGSYRTNAKAWLEIENDARWANYPSNAVTVSAWIRSETNNCGRIISCKTAYDQTRGFEFTIQNTTNTLNAIGHDNNQHCIGMKNKLNCKDDYVYATAVFKDGNSLIYVNGVLNDDAKATKYVVFPADKKLTIGKSWLGNLDEVRLQWAAQSADWIKADYDAQRNTDTFAVMGDLVDLEATTVNPEHYQRRATVTFSGYTGTATLGNFPALVRVPTNSPLYAGTKADGRDLRFTDLENNVVPHEVERWNKQGESLVWVRVPALTKTTQLYVYYRPLRNASVPAARSFRDVWGAAGYRGVWHFAGSALDSSPNDLQGVASGVTYATFGPLGQAFQSSANGTSSGGYVKVDDYSWWTGFDGRALTVSAWVHCTTEAEEYGRIVSTKFVDTEGAGFEVTKQKYNYCINANGNRVSGTGQHNVNISPHNFYTNTLYATFVFGNGRYETYVNGSLMNGGAGYGPILAPTNALCIGAKSSCVTKWYGQIDEVRIRWIASDLDWIKADYETQNPEVAFTTISDIECLRDVGCVIIFR